MVKLKIVIRDGYLAMRISENKTRHYKSLKSLLSGNPKLQFWSDTRQRFLSDAADWEGNNRRLAEFQLAYQRIIDAHPEYSVKEVAAQFEKLALVAKPVTDVKEKPIDKVYIYVQVVIEREKAKSGCNFELYHKLDRKLRKLFPDYETWTFDNMDYDMCARIAKVLLRYPGYVGTSKSFSNLLGKADKDRNIKFSKTQLDGFSFSALIPDKDEVDTARPDVLSEAQLKAFAELDPLSISTTARHPERAPLYKDFCMFMFASFMAPCDVIKLKRSNITRNNTLLFKRKKTHCRVEIPISETIRGIIGKYESGDYVFPIMNDEKASQYKTRDYIYKKFREEVAIWLKDVGRVIGTDFPLYPYVFRHTAITVALNHGLPIAYVATMAGTSIEMIQKHYYNNDSPQNDQRLQAVFSCCLQSAIV